MLADKDLAAFDSNDPSNPILPISQNSEHSTIGSSTNLNSPPEQSHDASERKKLRPRAPRRRPQLPQTGIIGTIQNGVSSYFGYMASSGMWGLLFSIFAFIIFGIYGLGVFLLFTLIAYFVSRRNNGFLLPLFQPQQTANAIITLQSRPQAIEQQQQHQQQHQQNENIHEISTNPQQTNAQNSTLLHVGLPTDSSPLISLSGM